MTPADKRLPQLPEPVYFVLKGRARWNDVFIARDSPPPIETVWERFDSDPVATWVLQTFIQLKRRGLAVHLVDRFIPGKICVVGLWHIGSRDLMGRSYNVVVQADCCRPAVADHVIVQNPSCIRSPTDHLVYHWPQPGLRHRDPGRGDRIETVVYRGTDNNLWDPLKKATFSDALAEIGVTFVYEKNGCPTLQSASWTNYREADIVLAMRDLTEYDERIKPATKLTNAWLAGVPAILGPESAYRDLRTDDLDYIEARSVSDVITAIRRLRENPMLYSAMRERACHRASQFSDDSIAQLWRNTLAGPIADGYRQWVKRPMFVQSLTAVVTHPFLYLRHKRTLRRYLIERAQGPTLLGSQSIETFPQR